MHCQLELPRNEFQRTLARLNPTWAAFLAEMLATGALATEDPAERRARGLRTNPDGDVDVPDAPYTTFRYPACPRCAASSPALVDGRRLEVRLDDDGAWAEGSTAGVLKPAVVMFGESIRPGVKEAVERAVDQGEKMIVVGSSLATYSAWRLAKRARERGMPIGIVNMSGVRGEADFFASVSPGNGGEQGVRCAEKAEVILPELVSLLQKSPEEMHAASEPDTVKLPSFGRLE